MAGVLRGVGSGGIASSPCLMNFSPTEGGMPRVLFPAAAAYMARLWVSDSKGICAPIGFFPIV